MTSFTAFAASLHPDVLKLISLAYESSSTSCLSLGIAARRLFVRELALLIQSCSMVVPLIFICCQHFSDLCNSNAPEHLANWNFSYGILILFADILATSYGKCIAIAYKLL